MDRQYKTGNASRYGLAMPDLWSSHGSLGCDMFRLSRKDCYRIDRHEGVMIKDDFMTIALLAYTGEICQGCGKSFDTIEDIKQGEAVWWPWEKGRIGHKACYEVSKLQVKPA
jgi:hypothetical protein